MSLDIFDYYVKFNDILKNFFSDKDHCSDLQRTIGILNSTKSSNSTIFLVGNGGSAAIAEHMAIDFTKNAGLRALAISGSPMLTTFSNDYGYERVFQKAIESYARKNDVLIAISSSGSSKNILNACAAAKEKKMKVITFSGFSEDNPLRKEGDINFWIDTKAFGFVEIIHNLLIHYICDAIIGSTEYTIR
jgi:D-sedoheptulose 7-phosphate isomerase